MALQSGTANIPFKGYDLTPSTGSSKDWFGPGAISTPQSISGHLGRFYIVQTGSYLSETLYRHAVHGYYGPAGDYQHWYTWADLDGITIYQWALETPDGKGGYLELSSDAAAALFGTGPLVTASANPVAYKASGIWKSTRARSYASLSRGEGRFEDLQ